MPTRSETAADLGGSGGDALAAELRSVGHAAGLDRIGYASAEPFPDVRAVLEQRRAVGLAADMAFTYRNPARSTDLRRSFPWARSLVVGLLRYPGPASGDPASGDPASGNPASGSHPLPGRPVARIAAYAASDCYADLRAGLGAVAQVLLDVGHRASVVADSNALVDRAAAVRAGLGWYGKNANVLAPGLGSWFVIGSVVTDADLPVGSSPVEGSCGSCRSCLPACPTGAIVAPGVVDARRCLAWIVQAPGPIPIELRAAVGDRLYGCDDCQLACPPSIRADRTPAPRPGAGGPGHAVDVIELLRSSDQELMARFGSFYLAGRDPDLLRRNAIVVLANTADRTDPAVADVLSEMLASGQPLLVEHASWACRQLGLAHLVAGGLR